MGVLTLPYKYGNPLSWFALDSEASTDIDLSVLTLGDWTKLVTLLTVDIMKSPSDDD